MIIVFFCALSRGRFELPTRGFSVLCSNLLSYLDKHPLCFYRQIYNIPKIPYCVILCDTVWYSTGSLGNQKLIVEIWHLSLSKHLEWLLTNKSITSRVTLDWQILTLHPKHFFEMSWPFDVRHLTLKGQDTFCTLLKVLKVCWPDILKGCYSDLSSLICYRFVSYG